jgi:hypothetical protein
MVRPSTANEYSRPNCDIRHRPLWGRSIIADVPIPHTPSAFSELISSNRLGDRGVPPCSKQSLRPQVSPRRPIEVALPRERFGPLAACNPRIAKKWTRCRLVHFFSSVPTARA